MIFSLITGALIGWLAGHFTQRTSRGCIWNVLAGLMGAMIGEQLFGYWGPSLAGMALIPSVLGAIIVIVVVSFFLGDNKR